MRTLGVLLGLMGILALAAPALGEVFVIGPGMLGHPADDPSVGYSSLSLDEASVYPDAPFAPAGANGPLGPGEEIWYEATPTPGV
jgi:hypothetical protein